MLATCLEKKIPELVHFHYPSPDSLPFPTGHVTKSSMSDIKSTQVMIPHEQKLFYLFFISLLWVQQTLI